MKKTKTIQLVLITAALASCNRTVYPTSDPSSTDNPGYSPDPGYYAVPITSDSTCPLDASAYDQGYYPDAYYPYGYTGTYFPDWAFNLFTDLRPVVYRSRSIRRVHGFVLRGGFGKRAVTTTAS